MQVLFPESFVRGIQYLRLMARRVPTGVQRGEQVSRHAGAGMDFRDYRPYVPGDDLRRIDWNVYRRSRRLFLRLFDEPRRLSVYILLDISDSMFFEDPPRADAGRRIAAALAAAAMPQHDRVTVHPFGSRLEPPIRVTPRGGLPSLLTSLHRLAPGGPAGIAMIVEQFAQLRLPPGLVVIVSDFFEPGGVEPLVTAMRRLRHRLVLVQMVRRSDRDPQLQGDLELLDCEGGPALRVTTTPQDLVHYRRRYAAFQQELHAFAVRRHAPLVCIDTDEPVLPQLHQLFPGGVLRA